MKWIAVLKVLLWCWVHVTVVSAACGWAMEPSDTGLLIAQRGADKQAEKPAAAQAGAKGASSENERVKEEQQVLSFVGTHQPKLLELMEFLKEKQPAQYAQAQREMSRSRSRLENLAKRDQDMYAIELELWQIRSRLRLLAAEISVAPESKQEKLNTTLAQLLEKEFAQDLARLKLQRERTAKQLEQFDQQISQRESEHSAQVEKMLRQWKNRIAQQKPQSKKPKQEK